MAMIGIDVIGMTCICISGCWCFPCLFASFPSTEESSPQPNKVALIENRVSSTIEPVGKNENLVTVIEKLTGTIDALENRSIEQAEQLTNISRALGEMTESNRDGWTTYNNKIMVLEERLGERESTDVDAYRIEDMKLELKRLKELYLKLQSCCTVNAELYASGNIEKHVERVISDYFGVAISKDDFSRIAKNFRAVDGKEYSGTGNINNVPDATDTTSIGDERVHEIVKQALKIYDADKTGRVDYALESAGGQIISTRCTQRYDVKTRAFKLLAFTLYHENNNPRTVIQGNPIQPGACWAFQGFPGYLLIKLRGFIHVTGFTVEHAPKSILPNGEMRSAPRKFNVWGFVEENDPEPVLLGDYEFAASDENLQYFPVQNAEVTVAYEYVELRVHSNHGQLDYTCLYRFRVHGRPI